jgi:hypothetical protein
MSKHGLKLGRLPMLNWGLKPSGQRLAFGASCMRGRCLIGLLSVLFKVTCFFSVVFFLRM